MARRSIARPSPNWVGDLAVTERTLQNGLRVLVLPRRHVPIVLCDLYYPVGSVDEPPGQSGLAHFVEHMLFKGTERFPKGQIDRLSLVAGGFANAETGEDSTHYWFAFPTDRWELTLDIEADRMRGANFDPREFEAERHVIMEEWRQDQDSPFGRLDLEHLTLSYLRHPYRNPILGWPDDLARLTVDDLKQFYHKHYRPDGALLVIVGDVEPEQAFDAVQARFDDLKPGTEPRPAPKIAEPRQVGRREFTLTGNETVARALLGWHTVEETHSDIPSLDVLADLLSVGRRSRLWTRLIEDEKLATVAECWQGTARRGGQFFAQIEGVPGVDHRRIEASLFETIEDLATQGPSSEELARSRNRLEAAWRWEQEDLAGLAAGLGHVALWGDWREWQKEHRAAMAVGVEDIRRVASAYLRESNLTIGWSLPQAGRLVTVMVPGEERSKVQRPAAPPAPDVELPASSLVGNGASRLPEYRPIRETLPNGMRLLHEHRPGTGVVAIELYVDAGQLRETKPGLAALTGRMLEEGTTHRTADELAELVEDAGGSLEASATGATLLVRAEDLPKALEWLADLALHPEFPDDSVRWIKRRMTAELQADRDDPVFAADLVFRSMLYDDHPYGRDPRGTVRQIASLTRADIVDHHQRYYRPSNAFLVVVGDYEPRKLLAQVKKPFLSWSGEPHRFPGLPKVPRSVSGKVRRVTRPGEQVHVMLGHLGIRRNHRDYDALMVLDHILGRGPGFTDRLSRVLRDELGVVYSVGGGIADSADLEPGLFQVSLSTGPDDARRAIAAVEEQIRLVHEGAFLDEEVDQARRYLAGSWVFEFQTVEQRAERLLIQERFGLSLEEPLLWPERIASVTPRQVRRAAREHLHPSALTRVEYGPLPRRGRRSAQADCA